MSGYTKQVTLDVSGNTSSIIITAKQRDNNSRFIFFKLVNGNEPIDIPEGTTVIFRGTKPDGKNFFNDCAILGEFIVADLTEQILVTPGRISAEIALYRENENVLTSVTFTVEVTETAYDEQSVISSNEFRALSRAFTKIKEVEASAHLHENKSIIDSFTTDQNSNLLFNGSPIKSENTSPANTLTIAEADTYADLPQAAEKGDIVFVENDSIFSEQFENTGIEPEREYPYLKIKNRFANNLLDLLPDTGEEKDRPGIAICKRTGTGIEEVGGFSILRMEDGICAMQFDWYCNNDLLSYAYIEDEIERSSDILYIYNFTQGLPLSVFEIDSDEELDIGWYKFTIIERGAYTLGEGGAHFSENLTIEPIEINGLADFNAFKNCFLRAVDMELEPEMLTEIFSGLFDICHEQLKEKGLYVFDGEEWEKIGNHKMNVYDNVLQLPLLAEEGQTALVRRSSVIYAKDPFRYFCEGSAFQKIYLNPLPSDKNFLFDFEIGGHTYSLQTGEAFDGGFELISNAGRGYALLSLPVAPTYPSRWYYIYSGTNQVITLDEEDIGNSNSVQLTVKKGWNKINMWYSENGEEIRVEPYESCLDLPYLDWGYDNPEIQCGFMITHCKIPGHFDNASLYTSIIFDDPVCKSDNSVGLWSFYNDKWQKLEDNLLYKNTVYDD